MADVLLIRREVNFFFLQIEIGNWVLLVLSQEHITNTSLAELEKQLKESPFKSPQVGESVGLVSESPLSDSTNSFVSLQQKQRSGSPVMTQPRNSYMRPAMTPISLASASFPWPTTWVRSIVRMLSVLGSV